MYFSQGQIRWVQGIDICHAVINIKQHTAHFRAWCLDELACPECIYDEKKALRKCWAVCIWTLNFSSHRHGKLGMLCFRPRA